MGVKSLDDVVIIAAAILQPTYQTTYILVDSFMIYLFLLKYLGSYS